MFNRLSKVEEVMDFVCLFLMLVEILKKYSILILLLERSVFHGGSELNILNPHVVNVSCSFCYNFRKKEDKGHLVIFELKFFFTYEKFM